jgi:hypothetical protein
MGHGGRRTGAGRPTGSKDPHTLEKDVARELVRAEITKVILPMVRAAIKRAMGSSYLVTRDAKNGKFIRVTGSTLKSTQTAIEVWEKEPDISAIKELLDRAIDKPKEALEIESKTDWDGYRERINAQRQRLHAAAKAAKKAAL